MGMQERLQEMEQRMLRNYMRTGIGMTVVAPILMIAPVPLGFWLGVLLLVVGVLSIVRSATLSSSMKRRTSS